MNPETNRPALPWWRVPLVWLVVGGPALVVLASIATAVIAVRGGDTPLHETAAAARPTPWHPPRRRATMQPHLVADAELARTGARGRFLRRALLILWPSFLMAGVLEAMVFAVVDPSGMHWFGADPIDGRAAPSTR
jgi:hypothetical protein